MRPCILTRPSSPDRRAQTPVRTCMRTFAAKVKQLRTLCTAATTLVLTRCRHLSLEMAWADSRRLWLLLPRKTADKSNEMNQDNDTQ